MKLSRRRIYEVIERAEDDDTISLVYDVLLMLTIVASLSPLVCMEKHDWFIYVNSVSCTIFIVDYLARLSTADIKLKKGISSFLIYPFSPMAIVDLVSILPYFSVMSGAFKVLRISRLVRIVRIFKFFRYSEKMMIFIRVLNKERSILLSVMLIALMYIFTTALVMFNVEPHVNPYTHEQTIHSFFDALYWATVTLTTVGYGDLCPVTEIGRFVSMLSSLFGVAIIALPSGVITASYLDELRKSKNDNNNLN